MKFAAAFLCCASAFAQPALKLQSTVDAHQGVAGTVAWRSDGKLVSAGPDGVKLWTGETAVVLSKTTGSGYGVAAVNGESVAAAGEFGGMLLPNKPLAGIKVEIRDFVFSPAGLLAVAAENKIVYLSDSKSAALVKQFTGHRAQVTAVAFHPSGKQLASGSFDNTIRIWDVESGKVLKTIPTAASSSLAFTPDGKMLVSAHTNGYIRLWDTSDWSQIAALKGGQEWVRTVSISPDGKWLVSGSGTQGSWTTGVIELWDLATRKVVASVPLDDTVQSVAFHPNGSQIASGHGLGFDVAEMNGRVRVWSVKR